MTRETVERMIREMIADELRHPEIDFHVGRVSALRLALELIEEMDSSNNDSQMVPPRTTTTVGG